MAAITFPRRMAPSDALFWYAETALPTFRPIIAGIYVLRETPSAAAMASAVHGVVRAIPRFRQRVVEAPLQLTTPEWLDDRDFDFDYHVRHLSVAAPGTMRELLDLAAALLATPLDRERPLWEAYWIGGLEGGRSAFFMKLHHSVVDGVGSLAILDGLTRPLSLDGAHLSFVGRPPRVTVGARAARAAAHNARALARTARTLASLPLSSVMHPLDTAARAAALGRGLLGVVTDARRPLIVDPLARHSRGLSRRLDVATVPLARLRDIKERWGVSINDVVLAALAASLAAYHRERGVRIASLNCLVPMNLRSRTEHDALGNRVGLCSVELPMGNSSAEERVRDIVAQTRAAKRDRRGALYPVLVEALTLLPATAFGWLARQALGRVNVACTNIPGVTETRSLGGAEIEAIYPFASVVEGTPLVMALMSYAGRMDIGVDTDPEAIPTPHRIVELFESALADLEATRPSEQWSLEVQLAKV